VESKKKPNSITSTSPKSVILGFKSASSTTLADLIWKRKGKMEKMKIKKDKRKKERND
jgi:hypothetical protein